MGRLDGKVAVVTGSARGIGATFAAALAKEGASVVVTDIIDVDEAVTAILSAGGKAIGVRCDVTRSADLQNLFAEAEKAFGPASILINNASLFANLAPKPFFEISDEEWDRVMTINVRGSFQCIKAALPGMKRNGGGKIVNISSGTFFYGAPGLAHYVASKGAIIGLTRSVARELGDFNIMVNAIAPGFTESDGVKANTAFHGLRGPTVASRALKRDMVPEDLVGTMLFLCSSESDFLTGQLINVDGGRSMY